MIGELVKCAAVSSLLPDDEAYRAAFDSAPEGRRRKCLAFRFEADRRRSLAAWLLLKELLTKAGCEVARMEFRETPQGRPYSPSLPHLGISLSHAGDYVMAAVAEGAVGCDVERIVPMDLAVAERCFTAAELRHLEAFPPGAAQDSEFIRLWTRKESVLKALGCGFLRDPRTIDTLDSVAGFRLVDVAAPSGYRAAFARR